MRKLFYALMFTLAGINLYYGSDGNAVNQIIGSLLLVEYSFIVAFRAARR